MTARLSVIPHDGVPNVQAAADVFNTAGAVVGFFNLVGGSGYSVAPTIIISGGGGEGATATTTITNGSVTNITITNNGSGYFGSPIFIIDPPAEGGTIEYAKTLQQHTVKTWEGGSYSWVLGVTASVSGAATLPSA